MNGWLLDTNIISQFAPNKRGNARSQPDLAIWVTNNSDFLFISVISVVEITAGIEKLHRTGETQRASDLRIWFSAIVEGYRDRVLPLDINVATIAGELVDHAHAAGRHPGQFDIIIAATAKAHDLGLLTNNIRHFEPLDLGIILVDPLTKLPSER